MRQRKRKKLGLRIGIVLTAVVFAFASRPASADLEEAFAAYHRGDIPGAVAAFEPLAAAGEPRAQYFLGIIYLNEMVEAADVAQGVRWIYQSAKQDYLPALNEMARIYRSGTGVEPDPKEMVYWYRRAAEQGDVGAQLFIADAYAYGYGVEPDLVEAFMWYEIAIQYWGTLAVPAREAIMGKMTNDEIDTALRRAEQWILTRME